MQNLFSSFVHIHVAASDGLSTKSDIVVSAEVASSYAVVCHRSATRAVTHHYDEALSACGLRGTQFTLLAAVTFAGEATMTQLAETLVMDRTTLTRNLGPLKREGLIKAGRGKDRRTRVVAVTERGRRALREAYPLWEKAQAAVVKGLGPKAWKELMATLTAAVSVSQGQTL